MPRACKQALFTNWSFPNPSEHDVKQMVTDAWKWFEKHPEGYV